MNFEDFLNGRVTREYLAAEVEAYMTIEHPIYEDIRNALEAESDRGIILTSVAFLEDKLKNLIYAYFHAAAAELTPLHPKRHLAKVSKELFQAMSPLSTFASRIKFAYILGLISDHELEDLEVVRKIRNAFAHNLKIVSFNDDAVVAQTNKLWVAKRDPEATKFIKKGATLDEIARNRLGATVGSLSSLIIGKTIILEKGFPIATIFGADFFKE